MKMSDKVVADELLGFKRLVSKFQVSLKMKQAVEIFGNLRFTF